MRIKLVFGLVGKRGPQALGIGSFYRRHLGGSRQHTDQAGSRCHVLSEMCRGTGLEQG